MFKKKSHKKMVSIITIIAVVALVLLLVILGILIKYNMSNKVLAQMLSITLVGVGTLITTILLNLKETKIKDHFATTIYLTNGTYDAPSPKPGEDIELSNALYRKRIRDIHSIQDAVSPSKLKLELDKIKDDEPESSGKKAQLIALYAKDVVTYGIFREIIDYNVKLHLNEDLPIGINIPETLSVKKLNFVEFKFSKKENFEGDFSTTFLMPQDKEWVLFLPENVGIKISKFRTSSEVFNENIITIYKENFFEAKIRLFLRSSSSSSSINNQGLKNQSKFTFVVIESAVFHAISSQHDLTEQYKILIQNIFSRIKTVYSDVEAKDLNSD